MATMPDNAMPDYLTTKEVAELLRIKERKVYDLAASGVIPCSKAMGKLLFPRQEVTSWIARAASGDTHALAERPNVFLGSHDPLLDWALRESLCGIATFFDGSTDGLVRFERHEGIATALHLYDSANDDWNKGLVAARLGRQPVVLAQWAMRQRGLIVSTGAAKSIGAVIDLRSKRVAPRQAESGAQRLFEHLLTREGLTTRDIQYTTAVRSETDAAICVLEGKCDASFGLAALATQYRLPFVPVIEEQFDILVERRAWFEPPMQRLLAFCRTPAFIERAAEMSGYDISHLGAVRFNGA